jgi:hypothetical protein
MTTASKPTHIMQKYSNIIILKNSASVSNGRKLKPGSENYGMRTWLPFKRRILLHPWSHRFTIGKASKSSDAYTYRHKRILDFSEVL